MRTTFNILPNFIQYELFSVFSDRTSSFRTVQRWSKAFRGCRRGIDNEARLGRSITETTAENIEQVRLLIDDDPYITIEEVQVQTDLSYRNYTTDHLRSFGAQKTYRSSCAEASP